MTTQDVVACDFCQCCASVQPSGISSKTSISPSLVIHGLMKPHPIEATFMREYEYEFLLILYASFLSLGIVFIAMYITMDVIQLEGSSSFSSMVFIP